MGVFDKFRRKPSQTQMAPSNVAPRASAEVEEKNPEPLRLEDGAAGTPGAHYIDPVMEKRVVRKLDWHVIPLVTALYLLSFLDRSNIGNAKIAGMSEDLSLTGDRYDWLLTIFYISYIVFEFQALMWKIVPPHVWAACTVLCWGLFATLQASVHNWQGEMALRFLLGLSEAGFGPGIPYLLSFFYLRHEVGFRCGVFLSAAPLANTFAGALAYGITSGHASIPNWRLLFMIEGLPTLVMAAVAFFFLPDTPDQARFLDEDEKRVAKARGVAQAGTEKRVGGIVWSDIGATLLDAKAWFTALMYFSCNVSFSSLPVFLPTILNEMGFSAINAQGLTAPPYFVSFLVTILTTWIADRTQQRGLMLTFLTLIGGIGYVVLATTTAVGPRYFGVFLAASGIFPAIANILPWVLNNQGTDTRRGAAMVLLNTVGQCGPLLGTRLYPAADKPFYVTGQAVCAAFMFFATLLVVALRALLAWENRRLERAEREAFAAEAEAGVEAEDEKGEGRVGGRENYGVGFRFVL